MRSTKIQDHAQWPNPHLLTLPVLNSILSPHVGSFKFWALGFFILAFDFLKYRS